MTVINERNPHPASAPRNDLGGAIEPAPYFHEWDPTPHAIFPTVGLGAVALGDVVFGGTHQIEGIGRAEQRGTPAVRLDLNYLVGPTMESSARVVLPVDHQLEVKRYFPEALGKHRYAWIKLDTEDNDNSSATLIPDYGSNRQFCCELKICGSAADDLNPHGYELSQIMCDGCVDSWEIDYEVVRS